MKIKDNLEIYNQVREVPNSAKKSIAGGRLKGMTDINPMWRIKKLTELFGPVGIGWCYDIIDKTVIDGANDEKVVIIEIKLFIKIGEEWSKGITGIGGSKLVEKESRGLYTNDEAFKMALTDALSVASKGLGIGADVYYQKDAQTKYNKNPEEQEKEKLRKNLSDIVGIKGIAPQKMTELIQERYQKQSSAELTIAELNDLKTYIAGI